LKQTSFINIDDSMGFFHPTLLKHSLDDNSMGILRSSGSAAGAVLGFVGMIGTGMIIVNCSLPTFILAQFDSSIVS